MNYLLSWYWERNENHGREVLRFSNEEKAREYAKENLDDDDTVLDYDIYVSILELKGAESRIEKLKSKIASAIFELKNIGE